MNKELLAKHKHNEEACRTWKQGEVKRGRSRDTVSYFDTLLLNIDKERSAHRQAVEAWDWTDGQKG